MCSTAILHKVGNKESICKTSKFTREDVNERLVPMRFEMSGQHQAANFVVGYAPTEPSDSEETSVLA